MFEPVYEVWDYYDGPRSGIASLQGEVWYFDREWDAASDDWSEYFTLRRLDSELLTLAEEIGTIWRDWEAAFHQGEVELSTHPGSPGQNSRFAMLTAAFDARIASMPSGRIPSATFRAIAGQSATPPGVLRDLEVEWGTTPGVEEMDR